MGIRRWDISSQGVYFGPIRSLQAIFYLTSREEWNPGCLLAISVFLYGTLFVSNCCSGVTFDCACAEEVYTFEHFAVLLLAVSSKREDVRALYGRENHGGRVILSSPFLNL